MKYSRPSQRFLEFLLILALAALVGSMTRGYSRHKVSEGFYVHNGGFTVSCLRLEAGRYEMRFSDCMRQDQWDSEGAYWVTEKSLVLEGINGRPDRHLEIHSDRLVEIRPDGYKAELEKSSSD